MNDPRQGWILPFILITLLILLVSCADTDPGVDDVVRETKEAALTASAFVVEQVAAYREVMHAKVEAMGPQIETLKARAGELSAQARTEWEARMVKLEARRVALQTRVDAAQAQGGEAWEDMQVGLDAAWNDLQTAFAQASSRFDAPADDG